MQAGMLDKDETELRLQACRGLTEEAVRALERRNLSEGLSGNIYQTGERLVFEDFQNDVRYQQLSGRNQAIAMGFATAAGFPIKANDKTIGVLHLASKARRQFAADELQHIESIAQEIGVAAQNARLFTEINQKTAELEQINNELQEANRAKSEFISAMSHELRTPLNVIMGNAELTGDGFFGDITPEQKRAMTQIHHHSQFLLKLVNDVLALSRLDAKKMSMELATVDVEEIIAHAQTHVEQLNRLNRLQVSWDIEPDLPQIVTDVTKLEEILQNLIGNAFKFTPQGHIEVRVRNRPDSGRIEFTVADTGIGIEPCDINRIFGAFEQIREAHTGDYNGVGLGLNIVKRYLELMNGDIHGGRMARQRFRAAEADRKLEDLQRIQEFEGGRLATADIEGEGRTGAGALGGEGAPQRRIRIVVREIVNLPDLRMIAQEIGHRPRIAVGPLHAG